jgi:hypothetical protein
MWRAAVQRMMRISSLLVFVAACSSGAGESASSTDAGDAKSETGVFEASTDDAADAAPARRGLGLFYLEPAYKDSAHFRAPTDSPGLTNPHLQGILWRQTWALLEPADQTFTTSAYLSIASQQSSSHSKKVAFQILAGQYSPEWFHQTNANHVLVYGDDSWTTVPWDTAFQAQWKALNQQLAQSFDADGDVAYVVMSGVGRASESFLGQSQDDLDRANALAASMGYSGTNPAVDAWEAGVEALIDMYMSVWSTRPIVLVTGPPFTLGAHDVVVDGKGNDPLAVVFDYGFSHHGCRFGARPDNLSPQGPQSTEFSAQLVADHAATCSAVGFQFANRQFDATNLGATLEHGLSFGANFIEVWTEDADDAMSNADMAAALDSATATILSR